MESIYSGEIEKKYSGFWDISNSTCVKKSIFRCVTHYTESAIKGPDGRCKMRQTLNMTTEIWSKNSVYVDFMINTEELPRSLYYSRIKQAILSLLWCLAFAFNISRWHTGGLKGAKVLCAAGCFPLLKFRVSTRTCLGYAAIITYGVCFFCRNISFIWKWYWRTKRHSMSSILQLLSEDLEPWMEYSDITDLSQPDHVRVKMIQSRW